MLIDENNANVLALFCESVEGRLNEGSFRLGIDDQEVLLCIGRVCNMTDTGEKKASNGAD